MNYSNHKTAGRQAVRSGSRYADKGTYSLKDLDTRKVRRRKPRRNQPAILIVVIAFLVLVAVCLAGTLYLYKSSQGADVQQVSIDLEMLDSPYAVLLEGDSGTVLSQKRSDEKIYPASMTKILTVLTAIEQIRDLDQTVTLDVGMYDALYAADASRAGFEPGEQATVRDLLYGALLPSGAECCIQLAMTAAGSEDAFVEMMNQKVDALGLAYSHFVNSTGLHDDQQYSTVTEIGQILKEALKNKEFYQVFTAKSYTVGSTNVHPDGFTVQSSMFKYLESPSVSGGTILGGKTGYTDEAGHCLASAAEIGGKTYILVTAGWASEPETDQYHISDAVKAYNAVGQALET